MPVVVAAVANGETHEVKVEVLYQKATCPKNSLPDDDLGVRQLLNEHLGHFAELGLAQRDHIEHEHLREHVECGKTHLEVDVINQGCQELDEAPREVHHILLLPKLSYHRFVLVHHAGGVRELSVSLLYGSRK